MGTTLYATMYPCHNCARHIVAAGIRKVIYIERYGESAFVLARIGIARYERHHFLANPCSMMLTLLPFMSSHRLRQRPKSSAAVMSAFGERCQHCCTRDDRSGFSCCHRVDATATSRATPTLAPSRFRSYAADKLGPCFPSAWFRHRSATSGRT